MFYLLIFAVDNGVDFVKIISDWIHPTVHILFQKSDWNETTKDCQDKHDEEGISNMFLQRILFIKYQNIMVWLSQIDWWIVSIHLDT